MPMRIRIRRFIQVLRLAWLSITILGGAAVCAWLGVLASGNR